MLAWRSSSSLELRSSSSGYLWRPWTFIQRLYVLLERLDRTSGKLLWNQILLVFRPLTHRNHFLPLHVYHLSVHQVLRRLVWGGVEVNWPRLTPLDILTTLREMNDLILSHRLHLSWHLLHPWWDMSDIFMVLYWYILIVHHHSLWRSRPFVHILDRWHWPLMHLIEVLVELRLHSGRMWHRRLFRQPLIWPFRLSSHHLVFELSWQHRVVDPLVVILDLLLFLLLLLLPLIG